MDTLFLGIDPGQNGGFAIINDKGHVVDVFPYDNDTDAILRIESWHKASPPRGIMRAVIENVHSMPGQGVASSFSFGRSVGVMHGALLALGIPIETMTPQAWQKILAIPKRNKANNEAQAAFKKRLLDVAKKMFPNVAPVNLKTADALLICEAYRRMYVGKTL